MNQSPVIAFLPCRKGSQRVKQKNIRTFAGIQGGLTRIKIEQLINCEKIDKIVVSTDDEEVITICETVLSSSSKKYKIDNRPKELASSETSTDELIKYVGQIIPEGEILWTHVTSPFITSTIYTDAIRAYQELKEQKICDSLTTVTKHQKFFWDKQGQPINYNRTNEKWPRTQTMNPIYELNSGIFLCDISIYRNLQDRVGVNPYLYELNSYQAMDVDWEEDFELAEILWSKNNLISSLNK
ncbi:cytidylyltransferase domain-containing protein [Schinkia sp. CFF1]